MNNVWIIYGISIIIWSQILIYYLYKKIQNPLIQMFNLQMLYISIIFSPIIIMAFPFLLISTWLTKRKLQKKLKEMINNEMP